MPLARLTTLCLVALLRGEALDVDLVTAEPPRGPRDELEVPVVHDPRAAPRAWAAIHAGRLWVCWDDRRGEATSCWSRVDLDATDDPRERDGDGEHDRFGADDGDDEEDLEDAADPDDAAIDLRDGWAADEPVADRGRERDELGVGGAGWRLGFADARRLVVRSPSGAIWAIDRGRAHPTRIQGDEGAQLGRPRPASCGAAGRVPTRESGRWSWREAPSCAEVPDGSTGPASCPAKRPGHATRSRPTAWRIEVGVELQRREERGWSASLDDPTRAAERNGSTRALLLVAVGLDPAGRQRSLAELRALARPAAVRLPPVEPGPFAAAEAASIAAILCASSRSR